jgi:phosphorylcholine metabolism protein LicD
MQHHKYSLSDIDGMIPWERDIYVKMLIEHLEKLKEEHEKARR